MLIAPGGELAGSFPADLQQDLVFAAAVGADTKEAAAAKAFIDFFKHRQRVRPQAVCPKRPGPK